MSAALKVYVSEKPRARWDARRLLPLAVPLTLWVLVLVGGLYLNAAKADLDDARRQLLETRKELDEQRRNSSDHNMMLDKMRRLEAANKGLMLHQLKQQRAGAVAPKPPEVGD